MARESYGVIVIGAGFGGSSCAGLLAQRGLDVLLVEKNQLAGRASREGVLYYAVPSNYDPNAAPEGKQMLMTGSFCPASPDLDAEEIRAWADAGETIGLGQIVGQCGADKPSIRAPIAGLFYVGCDAGGSGVGTQQAIESGMNVADTVTRYHRLRRASP